MSQSSRYEQGRDRIAQYTTIKLGPTADSVCIRDARERVELNFMAAATKELVYIYTCCTRIGRGMLREH